MASDEASLHALEALMNEFFNESANNHRKREIEQVLQNFAQQSGAWHHCVYFMNHSQNHYVLMYSLTVFENLINKQWIGVQPADKSEIRKFLTQYLLSHHRNVPVFVKNKLVKVVVDVGRIDWPHFYPNFFNSILELIQQHHTTSLGLVMLQTASEELAVPREDLSISRKEELHRLLLNEIPHVLSILTQLLDRVLEKHRRVATTVTPPPSPTHGMSPARSASPPVPGGSPLSLFSTSPLTDQTLQPSASSSLVGRFLNQSPKSRQNLVHPLPPLDPESEEVSGLALQCLSHLFSWIPLSSTITPSLLTTIFYFAEFGCNVGTSSNSVVLNGSNLGVLAMNCINELLSKNCVPAEFEEFLLKLFQQTFQLLQRITKDTGARAIETQLSELDDSYLNKFTEFLRVFVNVHLRRFESSSHFPVLELLTLLFKYTFKQPNNEGLYACLEIWTVFLDYLIGNVSSARSDKLAEAQAGVQQYKEVLMMLLNELVHKIQFCHNQSHLEELDDETLDDNNETEWQEYQRNCLEVVAKIAELLPAEAFSLLFPLFSEYSGVHLGLSQCIVKHSDGEQLNISGENECRRLHCTLRDLSTMERALGRLAEHFIGEVNFANRFNDGEAIVERLCRIALQGTQSKLYKLHTAIPTVLGPDLTEVHAQALAALQAYCHWLFQYHLETQRQPQLHSKFVTIISSILDALIPLLNKEVPQRISLPASHLLNSLTATVRPSFFIAMEKAQKLYHDVTMGALSNLSIEIQTLVIRSLSNALVLPWLNLADSEQEWTMRSANHQSLIKGLTSHFKELVETSGFADNKQLQNDAKRCIQFTLGVLKDLVKVVEVDHVTKTKVILCQSIQDTVQLALSVFPIYIHQPEITEVILQFLLALLENLKVQVGPAVTEQIVQQLLNIFTREQLTETILHESSAGARAVEKFLRILQLLVQEPAVSFKAFLPSIISLCMEQLYPILSDRPAPDIKSEFYELLHQLLLHNWRYFFRSSLLARMTGEEAVENQPQFVAILQTLCMAGRVPVVEGGCNVYQPAFIGNVPIKSGKLNRKTFGQSFLQPDISIFKRNLETLEDLNSKCKLYQKQMFKSGMLFQFINVLLQALVHRSHDLLQEEITITIYNMASVDFDSFYTGFLPQFLGGCEGVTQSQKSELSHNFKFDKDLPSFTHSVQRFVGDLRYYRLCNSSLPPGTVKF